MEIHPKGRIRLSMLAVVLLLLGRTDAFQTNSLTCSGDDPTRSSSCSSTIRDTILDSKLPRDLNSFKAWSKDSGILLVDGLNLSSSPEGDDWSLTLSKSLGEAQCLLTIPNSLILSSTKIRQEIGTDTSKAVDYLKAKNIEDQSHQFDLWIRLLQEYELGENSRWHGWMQSMPRTFNSAVSMDEMELECLPPFAWSLAKMVRFHHATFLEALDLVEEGCVSKDTQSDSELLHWMFNVVFTRCWGKADFDDENRHDLVPMGDMFNHGEPANVFIDYDEENNDCNIVLKEAVDPSTPLKLSYGHATTPSKFLSIFGFVDVSQPKIFCQILVTDPSQRHVDMGYDVNKMLFDTRDGSISEEVFDVTLYSILEQIPEMQEQLYQAHTKGDKETKAALLRQYHLETCIMIKRHIDATMKVLEEVLHKTTTLDPAEHPRLESIYRHNVFFHSTFWKAQKQINSMIQEEMKMRKN